MNRTLFKGKGSRGAPPADTVNAAGGVAYKMTDEQALAQLAVTGCLSDVFYANAEMQLEQVLEVAAKVPADYEARVALYAWEKGYMKDMPALLLAHLMRRDVAMAKRVFPRIVVNGKMLRNFVQVIRSGVTGRKSMATAPSALVSAYLAKRTPLELLRDSIGDKPDLADIIRLAHPKPPNAQYRAFYAWALGKKLDAEQQSALPEIVAAYDKMCKTGVLDLDVVTKLPIQMLGSLKMTDDAWKRTAVNLPWHALRMNLNALAKHGVWQDKEVLLRCCDKLRDLETIRKARVFPYQLLIAYKMTGTDVPNELREALQDAMEVAVENVPELPGRTWVFVDVSGSMRSPVTGIRKGATTAVQCVDVAALMAAAILRRNRDSNVLAFNDSVVEGSDRIVNRRDSVMTIAEKLAGRPSGGTNVSAPMRQLVDRNEPADTVVYVSDNQSWIDTAAHQYGMQEATETKHLWQTLKKRRPKARMVCVDLQPYPDAQAPSCADTLNVGGFSDAVFDLIALFAKGELTPDHWVGEIRKVQL